MRQNVEVEWKHLPSTLSTSGAYQGREMDAVSAICRFTLMIRANASEPRGLHWESVSVIYECSETSTADPWSPLRVCGVSTGVYLSFLGIPCSPPNSSPVGSLSRQLVSAVLLAGGVTRPLYQVALFGLTETRWTCERNMEIKVPFQILVNCFALLLPAVEACFHQVIKNENGNCNVLSRRVFFL